MITAYSIFPFAAAALLGTLAALHVVKGERRPQKTFFALSAAVLAAAQLFLGLMLSAREPQSVLLFARVLLSLSVFLPAFGIPFFRVFGRRNDREVISSNLPWIVTLVAVLAAAALMLHARLVVREVHFTEDGFFWGLTFSTYGKAVGVFLLFSNALFLYFFENTYRSLTVPGKVTLKYPLLGIIIASIINFVVISRLLALSVLDRSFFTVHSCGLLTLCISFLYATLRYRLFDVRVYVGRDVATSVLTLAISGLYLLALAAIAYLARVLGVPFDRFTVSIVGIFAVFLLIALLISGRAKRRLRRFINANFYFNRYDYRKEWRRYSQLMTSSQTIDDLLSNLISSLCDTMIVQSGFIWADVRGGRAAFYGLYEDRYDEAVIPDLKRLLAERPVKIFDTPPFTPPGSEGGGRAADLSWVTAAALLGGPGESMGLIALGPKDTGSRYTEEDTDFLETISDQAALSLENLLMEERMVESRQMEFFNRLTSFVIHDLKNTVGMLSLTAENARENMNDADFQKDAMDTVRRSVDKMKAMIRSLDTHKAPSSLSRIETDITALVGERIASLKHVAASKGVELEFSTEGTITTEIDHTAMERVIENLVLNAVEATPGGGKVSVRVERDGTDATGITVRDTGCGFDAVYMREDLFRPFHSTKKGGLGLGLVLCKNLVEAHGGKISIESEQGEGATIKVRLPASGG